MIGVLYCGAADGRDAYVEAIGRHLTTLGLSAEISDDLPPDTVDYLVYAPSGPVTDLRPYVRAKAVLSLWAGVEKIVVNPTLTQPLARMVDPGLTQGMVEWVVGHVLRHHLGIDAHRAAQAERSWREDLVPPLASQRTVGILGLGTLGQASAKALVGLGFDVVGWSRTAKSLSGVSTSHGTGGLLPTLQKSQILVLLLPETSATTNLLDATALAALPEGAVILNPGRGPLIDDKALIAALDAGQISHATLDVFREEPLPVDHPYWAHPKITVTPHIASATRTETASAEIAANIAGVEAGHPLRHAVNRDLGY